MKVGYLGPAGSNSHDAVLRLPGKPRPVAYHSFELIEALKKRKVDMVILPMENLTEGLVNWVSDLFLANNFPFCIEGEVILPIRHVLVGNGRLSDIKEVFSNPQALGQCRQFLNRLRVKTRDTDSTSGAVQLVADSGGKAVAAIGSELAAQLYGLPVIRRNIADNPNNKTRFIVIGRKRKKRTGGDKTSFIFGTKNRPGALAEVLMVFKVLHINMTMLMPRPSKKRLGEYVFLADIEAHQRDKHLEVAFQTLKEEKWVTFLKVLGSYQKAKKQSS